VVVSALLAVAVLAAAGCAVVERANVATGGGQSAGEAWAPAISADGQVVAFVSAASDLVPGDTNGAADVFVHDFATGDTERVSVVDGGGETLYPTYTYALSPDGRYVAFEALLGELIPGTGPPVALRRWVGVHVRGTDRTSVAGSPSANLVEVAAPQFLDSGYLSTRQTDIGVGPAPFRTTEQGPCRPDSRVSGDSRWCVEIVGQPGTAPPGGPGLLVQAPGAGGVATILDAELTVDGSAPEAAPTGFALSRTGRFVAFASAAADHDAGDGNGLADVFVVDRDPDGDGTFDQ
jgi:hypothetical protein